MRTQAATAGRSLFVRISLRLAIAALLLSLLEVVVVLIIYGSDRARLAEQLISLEAGRLGRIIREVPQAQAMQEVLARIEQPRGSDDWSFLIRSGDHVLTIPWRSAGAHVSGPYPRAFDWTRSETVADGVLVSGGRRLSGRNSEVWITLGVRGQGLALFAPVLVREVIDHVVLPVMPLTLVLLIVSVQIVRRMLAPLSAAAEQVDALHPSRLNSRLQAPVAPLEARVLVLAVNRALDRLQHAMTVLESFTAEAAHELRTPLAILRLRIDALEPGPLKDHLREDVAGMTRLVDQLLDLAQADVLNVAPGAVVDLSELAREVAARVQPIAFARGRDLRLIDHGGVCVAGHAEALARALNNLIDNALAYSPPDAAVEVIVGPGARLAVRDHGPGIPQEAYPFLFERFWRGPAQARAGAGLGLAIARSIVTRHGATIAAGNAHDGGAVFEIRWPAQSAGDACVRNAVQPPVSIGHAHVAVDFSPAVVASSVSGQ